MLTHIFVVLAGLVAHSEQVLESCVEHTVKVLAAQSIVKETPTGTGPEHLPEGAEATKAGVPVQAVSGQRVSRGEFEKDAGSG